MTRLPLDDRNVHGFEGPEYQLSRVCAHPSCTRIGHELHHLWRRSALGGPFNWVMLPDGSACGNLVRLCQAHHLQLTDNQAKISLENGGFFWIEDSCEWLPLSFQPPHILYEVERVHHDESAFENPGEKTEPVLENECPTCHRPLPHPKVETPLEKKRLRRTWSITVPADKREDGAETLDTLLEEARVEMDKAGLGYGEAKSVRFFVLATALGLFITHFREIINEG